MEIVRPIVQDVLNEGIMVTQVSAPVETEDMTKKQRETIIKKHMEQLSHPRKNETYRQTQVG